ncbi:MAG: hypothetical protein KDN19_19900 [Verrucomicrobiae bacterium]|nr:hypothetical protein [Verrucomicrobiae bacterium]
MKPNAKPSQAARRHQRGMSLMDLLLAAGGLFLAYTITTGVRNHLNGNWNEQRLKEVAARMITTTRYAEQAGVHLVDPGDLQGTIDRIAEGETAKSGPFTGQFYGVRDLDEKGRERVRNYLRIEQGRLALAADGESFWE